MKVVFEHSEVNQHFESSRTRKEYRLLRKAVKEDVEQKTAAEKADGQVEKQRRAILEIIGEPFQNKGRQQSHQLLQTSWTNIEKMSGVTPTEAILMQWLR